uniref:hypothetical protein n=1 Tax=uncultured Draconibacterium sp. TaxID=1573823 RepID=UPI003216DC0F
MKQLFSAILILSVFTFQFSELLVYVSFKLNQDFIAKNLCVEKDVEGSTCKGCCQLKKKINEQQKQKEEMPPDQSEKLEITFYAEQSGLKLWFNDDGIRLIVINTKGYLFCIYNNVFHPPNEMI